MIYWIIPVSIIIITISQISTKYKKGETKKYILNISYVLTTLLWIYGLIGGNIIIQEKWLEYEFQINLWKYMFLIILTAAINMIYYTLEWRYYKKQKKKIKKPKISEEKYPYENKIIPELITSETV